MDGEQLLDRTVSGLLAKVLVSLQLSERLHSLFGLYYFQYSHSSNFLTMALRS